MRNLNLSVDTFPVKGSFTIAHGSVSEIQVVTARIKDGIYSGRGECRPYARYGETPESVTAQIESIRAPIEAGLTLDELQKALPAGAARNAVDCALWDLRAKISGEPVYRALGLPPPKPCITAFTLSIDTPENMARAAREAKRYSLLKIKIGDMSGLEAVKFILSARPNIRLIVDANEALSPEELGHFRSELKRSGASGQIVMIEQPLPAALALDAPQDPDIMPMLCADESLHNAQDLCALWNAGYRAVNVKLDKCGGLTEGYNVMRRAKDMGFEIMAGCMVGTSLAMAPMLHLACLADIIDLDGPVLLAQDRATALKYDGDCVFPPSSKLWG